MLCICLLYTSNALNKNDYKDFTAVEDAVKAVTRGKNITEQAEVNAMAKAINDAIDALVRRSSGGGSSSATYPVNAPAKTENGTVTISPKNASKGRTVTITVKPDSGYKLDDLTVKDKDGNELKLTDKGSGKDVYKRQIWRYQEKAISFLYMIAITLLSVSYTHLDVYKRQVLRRAVLGLGKFLGKT